MRHHLHPRRGGRSDPGRPAPPRGPCRRPARVPSAGELSAALSALGAQGHLLGENGPGARRYRDSGMAGSPSGRSPGGLRQRRAERGRCGPCRAAPRPAAPTPSPRTTPRVATVTPTTSRPIGSPAALDQLADGELPTRTYEIRTPRTWAEEDRAWTTGSRLSGIRPRRSDAGGHPHPPSVVDDNEVTHVVVDPSTRARKLAAMRAHATQVIVATDDLHALSNLIARRTTDREAFRQVDPRTWQPVRGGVPGTAPAANSSADRFQREPPSMQPYVRPGTGHVRWERRDPTRISCADDLALARRTHGPERPTRHHHPAGPRRRSPGRRLRRPRRVVGAAPAIHGLRRRHPDRRAHRG